MNKAVRDDANLANDVPAVSKNKKMRDLSLAVHAKRAGEIRSRGGKDGFWERAGERGKFRER